MRINFCFSFKSLFSLHNFYPWYTKKKFLFVLKKSVIVMFEKLFFLFLLCSFLKQDKAYRSLPLQNFFVANSFQDGTGEVLLVIIIDKAWKLSSPADTTNCLVVLPKLSWKTPEKIPFIDLDWPEWMKSVSGTLEKHRNAVQMNAKKNLLRWRKT